MPSDTETKPRNDSPVDAARQPLGGRKPAKDSQQLSSRQADDTVKGKDSGKKDEKDSSLKIKIELDLEIEVHLTARIKGDITIGLL